jgi:hypothetical protein
MNFETGSVGDLIRWGMGTAKSILYVLIVIAVILGAIYASQ